MLAKPYKAGFKTEIEADTIPKGLSEETVRLISAKKEEPEWMLEFRLKAFRKWLTMEEPDWSDNRYPDIDYQAVSYYSAPKVMEKKKSLDEVDPELLKTFDKLGIPLSEQKRLSNVAVDAVFDSVSIATTFREDLAKAGVIFCSISEAIKEYPDLIKKHLGSVVPVGDNYFSALNAAVFSDGSFCDIPKGVKSPMELSTYFRINAESSGQFERTLIVAEEGSYVSYLEVHRSAYDENQLHAAVVEISAAKDAEVKYSTVQNWYAGTRREGGIYNFVTKRGLCKGENAKISWTQVETGSSITWKYPSVVLKGDNRGRVLQRGAHEQLPAGGHRHEDDPRGEKHPQSHREQGDQRGEEPQLLPRPGAGGPLGRGRAQLQPVRLHAHRRQGGREHLPVHRRS